MSRGYLDYDRYLQNALHGVVREALAEVAERGLMGRHHFFITFRTDHPEAGLPDFLREQFPEEMTIVLQNQFSGLAVAPDAFSVTLTFSKVPVTLNVPFAALVRFVDPSENFGLQMTPTTPDGARLGPAPERAAAAPETPESPAAGERGRTSGDEPEAAKVVTLDTFRKR